LLKSFDAASRKKYVADVYGIVAFAVALVHVMPYAHAAAARRKRRPKTNVSCKNHKFNAKCKNALRFVALLLHLVHPSQQSTALCICAPSN